MATSATGTMDAGPPQPVTESQPRRTVADYPTYAGAIADEAKRLLAAMPGRS